MRAMLVGAVFATVSAIPPAHAQQTQGEPKPVAPIAVGGVLGLGDKLVAVPVSQIKVGTEAKFTTDLTKDQLASAPAFVFGNPNSR